MSLYLFTPEGIDISSVSSISRVYVDCELDDSNLDQSIPYFVNGEAMSARYGDEPTEAVLVIKTNERVIAENRKLGQVFGHPATYSIYQREVEKSTNTKEFIIGETNGLSFITLYKKDDNYGNNAPSSNRVDTRTCARDLYKDLEGPAHLKYDDDFESWPNGGPDIRFDCIHYLSGQTGNSNTISQLFHYDKNTEGIWHHSYATFLTWHKSNFGDLMEYNVVEQDAGSSSENLTFNFSVNVGGSTYGVNASIPKNKDDVYGDFYVNYCDYVNPSDWGGNYVVGSEFECYINVH